MSKSLILALILSTFGIIIQFLFSIQGGMNQLGFTIAGFLLYFFFIKKVESTLLLNTHTLLSYFGCFLLILLLFIGDPTRGAKRWFFIGTFGLQPSMVFVPFFLLTLTSKILNTPLNSFARLIKIFIFAGIPILFVFKQPDLGTALVLTGTMAITILSAGIKPKHLIILVLVVLPIIITAPRFLKPYQRDRLVSFLNPQFDQSGLNYNSLQAEIAIGSGGIFGKGYQHATQSRLAFLPEAHTDFVFAAFTETFGIIGVAIAFSIYFSFLYTLLNERAIDKNNKIFTVYTAGMFGFIFVQFIFNVGMNLRLLPVVGVPLPFISYGGSSILAVYLLLGVREKIRTM